MVTSIVAAIIVLGILIVFHEFGHYWVARRMGVGVVKFSVGFGPKLFGRKVGETEYVVSAIPLGGFVKMIGEDPAEEVDPADEERAFQKAPLLRRTAIVLAGPVANLLLAFAAFSLVFMLYGTRVPSDSAEIGGVVDGAPAALAGLQTGDTVTSIDGEPISGWEDLSRLIRASEGRELLLGLDREGEALEVRLSPEAKEEKNIFGESEGTAYVIGIQRHLEKKNIGLIGSVIEGASQTAWWIKTLVMSLVKMVQGRIPAKDIGGPILIVQAAGEQARLGIEYLLHFMAVISINLGILNLLPIPVLDGGHLFFFAIEGVLRRPLALRHREIAQQLGLVILVSLMAFAFYNDIARVIGSMG